MLIINADDFGRNRFATDNIVSCYKRGSVTSTSAMVFMKDSLRAAHLAREHGMDVGLHLNLTQTIDQVIDNKPLLSYHHQIKKFLTFRKYSFLIYNPALCQAFDYVSKIQIEEFVRIFGDVPTHIDGHHHMHLCTNMVIKAVIPRGYIVRRNFTYSCGQKNWLNRAYRLFIDNILKRKYYLTDFLFSFIERKKNGLLSDDLKLAARFYVELQTHPESEIEMKWLKAHSFTTEIEHLDKGNFAKLNKLFMAKTQYS